VASQETVMCARGLPARPSSASEGMRMSDDEDDAAIAREWAEAGAYLRRVDPVYARKILDGVKRTARLIEEERETAELAFAPSPCRYRVPAPKTPPRPARPVSRTTP
jgi:hypothetical protein